MLERLRGGLIVSVQAYEGSVLEAPESIALLARCAVANGAVGVRVEGAARLTAVRHVVDVPIVGIIKQRHDGYEPYITSTLEEIEAVIASGAEIVAFDATRRKRPTGLTPADLVTATQARGALAMADCATVDDVEHAVAAGADIVATTLAGYTADTSGRSLPAFDLVTAIVARHPFAICEGGIETPSHARTAFAAGAAAIVVGTAITNVDALVRRFASAAPRGVG
ncbi:MAG: putative N-acetylmannosamine-6-phosphate 2-epimerase [Candidatus Eremiobacteraeota bacterium]|nr:putative N-acetylmannosamine-6-phosphate 2-epimerase [Candidatus Eremiobacteraeota bacterium]